MPHRRGRSTTQAGPGGLNSISCNLNGATPAKKVRGQKLVQAFSQQVADYGAMIYQGADHIPESIGRLNPVVKSP